MAVAGGFGWLRYREVLVRYAGRRFFWVCMCSCGLFCYLAGLPDLLSLDSPHLVPLDVRREAFKRTVLHLLSRLREVILI